MAIMVRAILSGFWGDEDKQVQAVEVGSWVASLSGYTVAEVQRGWDAYQRRGPRSRSSGRLTRPGAVDIIRHMTDGTVSADRGDKAKLSFDERELLETKVLPTARRWLSIPGLSEHGAQTLAFWGEEV